VSQIEPTPTPQPPGEDRVRVSDSDREVVAGRLNAAVSEGYLTLEEFTERVGQAYAARTRADLNGLLSDLPGPAPVAASQVEPYRPPEQRTRPRGPNSIAVGSIKKGGRWRLDRDTALGVVVGSVKLDLRGAELAAPDVTLAAECGYLTGSASWSTARPWWVPAGSTRTTGYRRTRPDRCCGCGWTPWSARSRCSGFDRPVDGASTGRHRPRRHDRAR